VSRLTVIFDGDCGICTRLANFVRNHDRAAQIELRSGHLPALYVRANEAEFTGARAVNVIAAELYPVIAPVLRAVAHVAPLMALEECGYALVARNRGRISRWLGF
jgi:predicted DCC family thiol-disulfide oxidoreductase YuxK